MSYADLDQLKTWLRIRDDADDTILQECLDSAARQIDHLCSRTFTTGFPESPTTTWTTPRWDADLRRWVLDLPDLGFGGLGVGGLQAWAWSDADGDWTQEIEFDSGYALRPLNALDAGDVYSLVVLPDGYAAPSSSSDLGDIVMVTAPFGWAEVPGAVVQANILQAARLWKRRDALFGLAHSLDGSTQTRLQERIDPDAQVLLRGYIKYWAAK